MAEPNPDESSSVASTKESIDVTDDSKKEPPSEVASVANSAEKESTIGNDPSITTATSDTSSSSSTESEEEDQETYPMVEEPVIKKNPLDGKHLKK